MSKEKLRVAIVGLGKMGLLHAGILNTIPSIQLTAFCDKSSITRRLFKKVFKTLEVVDEVEKLSAFNLDMVYVTTPIPSHYPVVKSVCANKIAPNLFVEKTLASSYDKAKEMCELAAASRGANMVGYMKRFAATFNKAKELVSQEAIGNLISFKAYAHSSDFLTVRKGSRAPATRGGVLRDLGGHIVDLTLWILGEYEVTSAVLESLGEDGSEDSAHFAVRSGGLEGEIDASWCVPNYRMPELGLAVKGSEGSIEVNDDKLALILNDDKPQIWYRHSLNDNVPFSLGGPEYSREDHHFVTSVLEKHNAEPSFDTAARVDRIIDLVKEESNKK